MKILIMTPGASNEFWTMQELTSDSTFHVFSLQFKKREFILCNAYVSPNGSDVSYPSSLRFVSFYKDLPMSCQILLLNDIQRVTKRFG